MRSKSLLAGRRLERGSCSLRPESICVSVGQATVVQTAFLSLLTFKLSVALLFSKEYFKKTFNCKIKGNALELTHTAGH